jgi:energy-coupling factor transporter ATP-binding protein EcfA2
MKTLEKIHLVQFFLFEQQTLPLKEITGLFGPNGHGKSSVIDAIQVAMFGANDNLQAFNAQADEQARSRSLRAYCLGQHGEGPDQRVRDNARTYITLIWRDTETGEPLSMGVCIYAAGDREKHEVLGRYILPGVELSMRDHLDVVDGEERPRAWELFRHNLNERSRVSGQEPLFSSSDRYINAALLALRGSGGAPVPGAFQRAFRFGLRMRFDKSVDGIVRDDVLGPRPTKTGRFREVTESFRRLADLVARVEAKIADGERVAKEYDKAALESSRAASWAALQKKGAHLVAGEALERARGASAKASDDLRACEREMEVAEKAASEAKEAAQNVRRLREAHSAHKDYSGLQADIRAADERALKRRTEITNGILQVKVALSKAAGSEFLTAQQGALKYGAEAMARLGTRLGSGSATQEELLDGLRPTLKVASDAFNALFRQGSALHSDLEAARTAVQGLEENLARVQSGRPPLSPNTQQLLRELRDHGIQATPVCDLVRIADPAWQPVVEAYLKNHVEALLVSANHEEAAFRVYRGLKGSQAVYGVKIAMESRQRIGKRPEPGSVAELIEGDNPAAVAYLRRQFGDRRCASSDAEALAGRSIMTKDGMLVSDGEMDRLRLVPPANFRIGAGSAEQRNALQADLARAKTAVETLEAREKALGELVGMLQGISSVDPLLKHFGEQWGHLDEALRDKADKTLQMAGMADEDYVRLGNEEAAAGERATAAEQAIRALSEKIGVAKSALETCQKEEAAAGKAADEALAAAEEARRHPEIDREYESRQWDALLEKYDCDFAAMVRHAEEHCAACTVSAGRAVTAGGMELGKFRGTHFQEPFPKEAEDDWKKAREWLAVLLARLRASDLSEYKQQMDEAYRTSQETFRNDVAHDLNGNLTWLDETMERLNAALSACPTFSNGERYRFRRVVRPQHEHLLKFVKDVGTHGPVGDLLGGPGEMPDEFRNLLQDKITLGAGARSPLDDYREFFEFDIEIVREDPLTKARRVVGHLSKRLGTGSGGEHRAPLYVIAGAALASAYRLDSGHRDGLRLMLLDEAFNKMDMTNIVATMRYLEDLGLQLVMASPGENVGILTAFLHRYYDILRDSDNNTVLLEGYDVSAATRELFRSDLPEFSPELIGQEVAAMRSAVVPAEPIQEVA